MKDKLKKFLIEHDGVALGIALFVVVCVMMSLTLVNRNSEKNTPIESTSEKSIKATSFDYKGHQYILFEESRRFGASSILHNPDCKKCKLTQEIKIID